MAVNFVISHSAIVHQMLVHCRLLNRCWSSGVNYFAHVLPDYHAAEKIWHCPIHALKFLKAVLLLGVLGLHLEYLGCQSRCCCCASYYFIITGLFDRCSILEISIASTVLGRRRLLALSVLQDDLHSALLLPRTSSFLINFINVVVLVCSDFLWWEILLVFKISAFI